MMDNKVISIENDTLDTATTDNVDVILHETESGIHSFLKAWKKQ